MIGVINDSTQVRLGKTILYETNGVFQIWRYNAAGDAASARIMLTEDELTLFSNGRELHLGTGRASMRAFGKGFEITPTSIKIAGLPEGVASRMIALNASGDLISAPVPKGGGGTGPHPTGTWVWPFPLSATTSEFEPRWGRFHEGIDLGNAPALNGAQIRSAGPGTVQTAGYHSDDGFGYWVVVNHGDWAVNGTTYTVRTVYGHMLQSPSVSAGQQVTSSTVLGLVGNTGGSFGAHLHFETHLCAAGGGGIIWRNGDPSWDTDRTANNPRTVMSGLRASGG